MTTVSVDPLPDVHRIEADQVAPLDEGDPPLRHQPPNVTSVDAEMLSQTRDVEQPRHPVHLVDSSHALLLEVVTVVAPN